MTGSNSSNGTAGLQPGQWEEISNSQLTSVLYNGPLANEIHGNTGPEAIMSAWSGGVFDTNSDSLVVWGGGHNDYYGNEVYSFNLNTLQWSRLDDPSSIANRTASPVLPDGKPAAEHTYDALAFIPGSNEMFATVSGAANGNGDSFQNTWAFNPTTKTWQQEALFPGTPAPGQVAAYDAATGHVFAANNLSNGLYEYDPSKNTWTAHGNQGIPDFHMTAAIDPVDHLFVAIGNGELQAYSINGGATGTVVKTSATGDLAAENGASPGFVWDSAANEFVAWNGGSTHRDRRRHLRLESA